LVHGLRLTDVVLDVGAGIRPMRLWQPKRHICLEPYGPYAQRLRQAGYEVIEARVQDVVYDVTLPMVDTILMLDVLEHLTQEDGLAVLDWATAVAREQVVVFTPNGFKEQTTDVWGLGGHAWQTHRSGWRPRDFPGWTISEPLPQQFAAVWDARG